jgi:hypothetical protein
MKNKLVMAALAAAILCGLAFSACKNDVMDVKRAYDKAEAVESVTAVKVTNQARVIVTWDAVDDSQGYVVYVKVGDAKTLKRVGGWNGVTYAADGTSSPNTDPNKWAASVTFGISNSSVTLPAGTHSVTFGVQTYPIDWDNGAPSDIVWSDPVSITVP